MPSQFLNEPKIALKKFGKRLFYTQNRQKSPAEQSKFTENLDFQRYLSAFKA